MTTPHQSHWLFLFGAMSLGLLVGWQTYRRRTALRTDRFIQVGGGIAAFCTGMAIASRASVDYGSLLGFGAVLAMLYTGGCFIGWSLRDLAEAMPAAALSSAGMPPAETGSYLFRDAFAGTGAGGVFLRTPHADGRVARERVEFHAREPARAPMPGGYTFPQTPPYSDIAMGGRTERSTGLRPHWSWSKDAGPQAPPQP